MLRLLAGGSLLLTLIAGCDWTPERDNPFDPLADGYRAPFLNHPPVIDTLYAVSHCTRSTSGSTCDFEVLCRAHDDENNIDLTAVRLDVAETTSDPFEFYGLLSHDAVRRLYFLRDRPHGLKQVGPGWLLRVTVTDDSGESVQQVTSFQDWFEDYPVLRFPWEQSSDPVDIFPDDTVFSWAPWNGSNGESFTVTFFYRGIAPFLWDTTGIPATDTSVVIHYPWRNALHNPENWYSWRTTIHTTLGHSATSLHGTFQYIEPDGEPPAAEPPVPSAMIRREEYLE